MEKYTYSVNVTHSALANEGVVYCYIVTVESPDEESAREQVEALVDNVWESEIILIDGEEEI